MNNNNTYVHFVSDCLFSNLYCDLFRLAQVYMLICVPYFTCLKGF